MLPWRRPVHSSTKAPPTPPFAESRERLPGPNLLSIRYWRRHSPLRISPSTIVTAIRPQQIEGGGDGNQGLKQLIGLYDTLELILIIAERQQMNVLLPAS